MKRVITYIFLFFVVNSAFSQITFTVIQQYVECNYQSYGAAEVHVTSTVTPYSYLWNTGDTTNSISNLNVGNYFVVITDSLGNDTTVSFDIKLRICEMAPEIVFTPNNDGINDTWFIANAQYFPKARFMVFNRLGQIVYEQKGLYQTWDGKDLFGITLPDASYYYVIYHDKSDEGTIIKGAVSVLK